MYSQRTLSNMSVINLVHQIKNLAHCVDNNIFSPHDAIKHVDAIIKLSTELRDRIECVIEE